MKSLIFASLLVTSCVGRSTPFTVSVANQPSWVETAAQNAANFWAEHNEVFIIGDEGEIRVSVKSLDKAWGEYSQGEVWLSPNLESLETNVRELGEECVTAHELGHAIGMLHVKPATLSLMAPMLTVDGDHCPWSNLDQTELCIATGDGCS